MDAVGLVAFGHFSGCVWASGMRLSRIGYGLGKANMNTICYATV